MRFTRKSRPRGETDAHAPPDFDRAMFEKLRGILGTTKLEAFIQLYLDGTRQHISALRTAAETSAPADRAALAAHSIKSSSAQIGAMQLSHFAERTELLADDLASQGASSATLLSAAHLMDEHFNKTEPLLRSALHAETGPHVPVTDPHLSLPRHHGHDKSAHGTEQHGRKPSAASGASLWKMMKRLIMPG